MNNEYQAVNILIIDDSPINLKYLGKLLNLQGYQVQLATSGELGLKMAVDTRPNLIILDIMMPGLDGYDVCQRLKADVITQHIPIIFLSVIEEVSEKVKAFRLGAADYVTKPLQKDEILARIDHQLTIQNLHHQLKIQNLQLKAEIKSRQQLEEKFYQVFLNSQNPMTLKTINDIDQKELAQKGQEKIEESLKISEIKYRNLVETSQDIIWSVDLKGCYTFVNPAVKTIMGYEPLEVIGRIFSNFVPIDQVAVTGVQTCALPIFSGSIFSQKSYS